MYILNLRFSLDMRPGVGVLGRMAILVLVFWGPPLCKLLSPNSALKLECLLSLQTQVYICVRV